MNPAPAPGFVLTTNTTVRSSDLASALGLKTAIVPRGVAVPASVWHLIANLPSMISAGMLAWRPPARPPRSAPAIAAKPAPPPARPRDFIGELRLLLKPFLDRGVGLDVALDCVPAQAVLSAQTQFAHRAGQGPGQRSVQGFRAHLMEASS